MARDSKPHRDLLVGLGFLAPNILGFLAFVFFPLLFSLVMAFTNWDLQLHNMFKEEPLRAVGWEHFGRLLHSGLFWKYLRNTLFLMIGIPFGIAGSLFAAIMLSRNLRGGGRTWTLLILAALLISSLTVLALVGGGATAMAIVLGGLAGLVLLLGVLGGNTVYRTLFFMPHFTAGVATFILWKKLYSPHTGPINNGLSPVLDRLAEGVGLLPADIVQGGSWGCAGVVAFLLLFGFVKFWSLWNDGEIGLLAVLVGSLFLALPCAFVGQWLKNGDASWAIWGAAFAGAVGAFGVAMVRGRDFLCSRNEGVGHAAVLGAVLMIGQFVMIGLSNVFFDLPAMASDGLAPPEWLTNYDWAKPAIMLMAFWAAIGSNNMLLYLAGLSNIPVELYEVADIDGANRFETFWHVTWPQLAPVTFFIVVMSVIHGLQGGFEMARTMTQGGPAGATTTLSYFIYTEGFETGRLGYASAIAWSLFGLVFVATFFNWRFGNRYVNE
ncbi:sugar ABC transporter permease [bacterium]|nr:sugar ABC transporter permease [bacterium]